MISLISENKQSWLAWFLRGILLILFLILFAKLFEVQIIKGEYFRTLSEENRIRHIPIPAPRGKILARGGEVLAGNVDVKRRIKFASNGTFEITDDLTSALPEEIITDYMRNYPLGDKFDAAGYLGAVSADEIGKVNPGCPEKGPIPSDGLVGKTGLELQYECLLRGVPGEELIEVNTQGKKVRTLGRREPIPGQDLKTNIDYGMQTQVASEMGQKKGAAIVTDAKGEIMAFYSGPSFDPNLFVTKGNSKEISSLFNDPTLPLFDRVISGTFHPGSVFKPLVSVAALEERVIDKSFVFTDPGVINVGSFSYSNWFFTQDGRTEGTINLIRAIARSTDTFFYTIGQMLGPNAIAKWADNFGLNKPTGVDIPGEAHGLVPTADWKKQTIKESWFLGDTYHMSIGQGYVALTPIEVNTYISGVANKGSICIPSFAMGSPKCRETGVNQKNLDLVTQGMKAACTTGGTAYTFFDFGSTHKGIDVACKTGTAEVGTDGTPHAWFTFFAPADNPQIVATVLFEKGGEGSSVAGPVARKIADFFFNK